MRPSWHVIALCAALMLSVMLAAVGAPAAAQAPTPMSFCFVPLTGTVYRIKTPQTRPACASSAHIEFSITDGAGAIRVGDAAGGDLSGAFPNPTVARLQGRPVANAAPTAGQVLTWNGTVWSPAAVPSGPGGTSDHGALSGLTDDDHPQYLLRDGVRPTINGFAVTGALNTGSIPISGSGTRLMWYPAKSAFRAGTVSGSHWDDANVGRHSVAVGNNTTASGIGSVALGDGAVASARRAVAFGQSRATGINATALGGSIASGEFATAMGTGSTATGLASFAAGNSVIADADLAFVLGYFATAQGHDGAFVYGDASTSRVFAATTDNSFNVRAAGGTWFFSSANVTTGVHLAPGDGAWSTLSDANRKHLFEDVNGEDVLEKVAALPIRSWSYITHDANIRHLGPTAQDFYAAFRLGGSDTSITTVDADGVSLLAIQALEKRTDELKAKTTEIETLHAMIAELHRELDTLRREHEQISTRLQRLEATSNR